MNDLLQSTEIQAAITSLIALLLAKVIQHVLTMLRDHKDSQYAALLECVAAAVEQVYQQEVRPHKASLTATAEPGEEPAPPSVLKRRWNALAVENAEKIARDRGLNLKGILGKAAKTILPMLVSQAVSIAKGRM